ncbi:MAG: aspartate kinase [Calditrichia bacterium]
MALIVQKYGGSSLATPELIKRVASHIVQEKQKGYDMVVVVSAIGETTDQLVELSRQITRNPSKREMDMLLSVGERISIALLAMAIQELGQDAISFTGSQVGIITDNQHTEARILEVRANRLLEELRKGKVVIVAGFQGVSINKEITTLGRGGSDTTAIALAAALNADRCEIMKDVDGIFMAEPRLIPEVRLNKEVSYDELIEMTHMGAGVLKTESVEIAKKYQISVAVGSSFTGRTGTIVSNRSLESSGVTAIVGEKKLVLFRVRSRSREVAAALLRHIGENRIKLFTQHLENHTLSLVVRSENSAELETVLNRFLESEEDYELSILHDLGMVAIIGRGLNLNSELANRLVSAIFSGVDELPWLEISQLRISFLCPEQKTDELVKQFYRDFVLAEEAEENFNED